VDSEVEERLQQKPALRSLRHSRTIIKHSKYMGGDMEMIEMDNCILFFKGLLRK